MAGHTAEWSKLGDCWPSRLTRSQDKLHCFSFIHVFQADQPTVNIMLLTYKHSCMFLNFCPRRISFTVVQFIPALCSCYLEECTSIESCGKDHMGCTSRQGLMFHAGHEASSWNSALYSGQLTMIFNVAWKIPSTRGTQEVAEICVVWLLRQSPWNTWLKLSAWAMHLPPIMLTSVSSVQAHMLRNWLWGLPCSWYYFVTIERRNKHFDIHLNIFQAKSDIFLQFCSITS